MIHLGCRYSFFGGEDQTLSRHTSEFFSMERRDVVGQQNRPRSPRDLSSLNHKKNPTHQHATGNRGEVEKLRAANSLQERQKYVLHLESSYAQLHWKNSPTASKIVIEDDADHHQYRRKNKRETVQDQQRYYCRKPEINDPVPL